MRTKRLGDMLLELGLITQEQLKQALEFQSREKGRLRIYCCDTYNLVAALSGCCCGCAAASCCRSLCCGCACRISGTAACSEGRCKHTAQDNSCQCLFHVCFLPSSFSLYASFVIPNSMMSFRFPSRNRCPDTVTKKGRIPRPIFLR